MSQKKTEGINSPHATKVYYSYVYVHIKVKSITALSGVELRIQIKYCPTFVS
jgi:hypothetical protein